MNKKTLQTNFRLTTQKRTNLHIIRVNECTTTVHTSKLIMYTGTESKQLFLHHNSCAQELNYNSSDELNTMRLSEQLMNSLLYLLTCLLAKLKNNTPMVESSWTWQTKLKHTLSKEEIFLKNKVTDKINTASMRLPKLTRKLWNPFYFSFKQVTKKNLRNNTPRLHR